MATISMDTVVIGGGITGAAIVYALARRGVRHLLLLEQRTPAPSGPNGFFGVARTYYDNSVMVTLARRSLRIYEHFADEVGGTADFVRAGLLVLVLPWFIAIYARVGTQFLIGSVGEDMLAKVASPQETHGAPPGLYLILFFVTFFPASILVCMPPRDNPDPAAPAMASISGVIRSTRGTSCAVAPVPGGAS